MENNTSNNQEKNQVQNNRLLSLTSVSNESFRDDVNFPSQESRSAANISFTPTQETPHDWGTKKKGSFPWLSIMAVVILLGLLTGAGVYYLSQKKNFESGKSRLSEFSGVETIHSRKMFPTREEIPRDEALDRAIQLYETGYTKNARSQFTDIVQSDKPGNIKSYALVYLGAIADQEGKYAQAIDYFQKAVKYEPENFYAHYNMAITYKNKGDYKAAQEEIELAAKIRPDLVDIGLLKGELQYEMNDLSGARKTLENVAEDSQNANAFYNLGMVYKKEGKLSEAKVAFLKSMELPGAAEVAHLAATQLGIIFATQGDYSNAEVHFKQAISLFPGKAKYYYNLALVQYRLGHNEDAILTLERSLQMTAENPRTFMYIAGLYEKLGDMEHAETALRRAMELAPMDMDILGKFSDILVSRSRWDEAVSVLEQIMRHSTRTIERSQALFNLGRVYTELGQLKKAQEYLEYAYTLDPGNEDSLIALGNVYYMQGNPHKTVDLYKKSLEINPDNVGLVKALANLYYKLNLFAESEVMYERVSRHPLAKEKDILESSLYLGKILKSKKDYDGAISKFEKLAEAGDKETRYNALIELSDSIIKSDYSARKTFSHLEKAISLKPESTNARLILAQALLKEGSIESRDRAEEELSALIRMTEDPLILSHAYNLRGIIYYKQGMGEKAANNFERSLEYDPSNQDAFQNKRLAEKIMERGY